ncbi:nucleolus and neural progenitor protein isoform X2 [Hemicordylus capensis]|uniref:nucleolus and neural progenitor protein isoform X2 n=1 Tax=Hemicordylus capensis TaxID=884348 RepID=UPI002304BD28|nr:nucleolus and neural progenitor protein isoform X2 [Hemicordylus capensis]
MSSKVLVLKQNLCPSVRCLSAVMKGCHVVRNILKSKAVTAEQRLLHSILYSFHYQMRSHRPYRSLKQVEQCLKHLHLMNLEKSVQNLVQLDPMKLKSENLKESLVPSQPVIEVVLVKILGGCKLLLRLFECCCTAFLLTVKHLCLEEYILFNTVVLGLLSRLWILYRGVLKSLSSLYESLFELLQEVSKIEPRPYIKGFAFPSEINEFLGTTYSEIKEKMPKAFVTKKAEWMNKLFPGGKTTLQTRALVRTAAPTRARKKTMSARNITDIGKPVLAKRTNQDLGKEWKFDVKTLFRSPNPASQESSQFRGKLSESKRSTSVPPKSQRLQHLKTFVSSFREAHSFGDLSDALRTTILWCKSNKLGPEAFFLGMKLLKTRRLQHVEAQGWRLQRKLGCVKATICKYLRISSCRRRPHKVLRPCKQRRIKLPGCVSKRIQRNTCVNRDANCRTALPQRSEHLSKARKIDIGSTTIAKPEEERDASRPLVLPASIQKEALESKDDIDDIFGAIGL